MKDKKNSHTDLSWLIIPFALVAAAAHLLVDPHAAKWKRAVSFMGFTALLTATGFAAWKLLCAIFDAFVVKAF